MAQEVRSPIGGTVQNILVEPGAKVAVDDELIVVEAMKMQNSIHAPITGTVKEVRVKTGDRIEGETVLMIIE